MKATTERAAKYIAGATALFAVLKKAEEGSSTIQTWRQKLREKTNFLVTIEDDDPLYERVEEELFPSIPKMHLVQGHYVRDVKRLPIRFSYLGAGKQHRLTINGETVRVEFGRTGGAAAVGGSDDSEGGHIRAALEGISGRKGAAAKLTICITCPTEAARNTIALWLAEMAEELRAADRQPEFHIAQSWGGWNRVKNVPDRPLESIILPEGQLERVVDDLATFLESEDRYENLAMPWHRGYLFSGLPGSGKTSLARALASHFGLDLWYLPLSDVKMDSGLMSLIAEIRKGGILLLEDVDVVHAATSRDDDDEITLSGLLNSLDGIATPNGLITIMTTNDVTQLDPALIRPGRVDLHEVLGSATKDQAARIFDWFYGEPINIRDDVPEGISTAQITGALKQHLDDPDAGTLALWEALAE